jgi:sulfur carrier protein
MLLIINGKNENLESTHLIDVVNHYDLHGKMIVIEANGLIIPQELWETSAVTEGMRIEIVHFVGGG